MKQLQVIVLFCFFASALAYRMCLQDSDCEDLGDLECIKSACSWGNCGCRRGYVSRFIGTERIYKCVKLKKIGEECNTQGTKGICGAANSDCVSGVCTCDTGFEARFGGEECLSEKTPYPSETCGAAFGAFCDAGATCATSGGWYGSFTGGLVSSLGNAPLDDTPNTCACSTGYRTTLKNAYSDASFVGATVPTCEIIAAGELCMIDEDCGEILGPDGSGGWSSGVGANCTNNACTCGSGLVPDISGLYCGPAISYGDTCMVSNTAANSSVGVCNGDAGMRCGSPCDLSNYLNNGDYTCACDPAYIDNGDNTCTARVVGDECDGDLNCKAIGDRAVCTEGKCKSGATAWMVSSTLLAITLLFSMLQ